MRIGVDIRPLQGHSKVRGIGRYLKSVLENLPAEAHKDHFVFYADRSMELPDSVLDIFNNKEIKWVHKKKIAKVKYVRALARPYVKVKPSPKDIDVFFQAESAYGISSYVPSVAVFYDIIPMLFKLDKESLGLRGIVKYKQIYGEKFQDRFYRQVLSSYSNAACILTISKWSKRDYLKYVDPSAGDKIVVSQLGVSGALKTKSSAQNDKKILKKYALTDSRYLLYVGAIDQRKNVAQLAKDFFALKKDYPNLKLVAVGGEFSLARDLKKVGWTAALESDPKAAKDIIVPGFVDDEALSALYRNAVAFVFPSRYEGFGLPVLEAMQLSCPVVCYDNSSLPEVAGEAALVVKDGESMIPAIRRLLDDPALRKSLVEKGKKQVEKFNWQTTSAVTYQALRKAAK